MTAMLSVKLATGAMTAARAICCLIVVGTEDHLDLHSACSSQEVLQSQPSTAEQLCIKAALRGGGYQVVGMADGECRRMPPGGGV